VRQMDIDLKSPPQSELLFRAWPDVEDYEEVTLLKVKDDRERKHLYILGPAVADLDHVVAKARPGRLIPCVTRTGRVFVWALPDPIQDDNLTFGMLCGLADICEKARTTWVGVGWNPKVCEVKPPEPIDEEARWPSGQRPEEWCRLAMRSA